MLAVVDDVAVVEARMKAVGEIGAAGHSKGVGSGAAGIGKIAGPGIAGVEGDAFAAVPRELRGATR